MQFLLSLGGIFYRLQQPPPAVSEGGTGGEGGGEGLGEEARGAWEDEQQGEEEQQREKEQQGEEEQQDMNEELLHLLQIRITQV